MEKSESWLSYTGVAPVSKVTQQSFHGEEQEHAMGDVLAEYPGNGNRGKRILEYNGKDICVFVCVNQVISAV